jgi:hypothetical protein
MAENNVKMAMLSNVGRPVPPNEENLTIAESRTTIVEKM